MLFIRYLNPQESTQGEKLLGVGRRTFKGLKSFFSRGENGENSKKSEKCSPNSS